MEMCIIIGQKRKRKVGREERKNGIILIYLFINGASTYKYTEKTIFYNKIIRKQFYSECFFVRFSVLLKISVNIDFFMV